MDRAYRKAPKAWIRTPIDRSTIRGINRLITPSCTKWFNTRFFCPSLFTDLSPKMEARATHVASRVVLCRLVNYRKESISCKNHYKVRYGKQHKNDVPRPIIVENQCLERFLFFPVIHSVYSSSSNATFLLCPLGFFCFPTAVAAPLRLRRSAFFAPIHENQSSDWCLLIGQISKPNSNPTAAKNGKTELTTVHHGRDCTDICIATVERKARRQ